MVIHCHDAPIPLVLNKRARGSHSSKIVEWVKKHPERFDPVISGDLEFVRKEVRRLVNEGALLIAAAGGDGTLNTVAGELLGSDTALGIIPSGTMNVFARELNLPLNDYEASYDILRKGNCTEVDIFEANGIPFLQMCGIGFDAQVVKGTTWEKKKKWGPLAYAMTAVNVLREKPPSLILTTPDGTEHEGVFAVMGNGSLYGGQLKLFPEAVYHDGLLDIMLFKELGFQVFSQFIRAVFRKNALPDPRHVEYLKVKECRIESTAEVPFEVDGDARGFSPLHVKLSSSKLRIVVP